MILVLPNYQSFRECIDMLCFFSFLSFFLYNFQQGERSTLKYLNSYVVNHTLPKVSSAELKKRKIPTKTTLRPREIKQLLDV